MSLKDLLPPGTFDEIAQEAHYQSQDELTSNEQASSQSQPNRGILVRCPTCHKLVPFDKSNPFRPFCSERCKLVDLGEWASEERTIPGRPINQDEDADLLNDPNLPVRHTPQNN